VEEQVRVTGLAPDRFRRVCSLVGLVAALALPLLVIGMEEEIARGRENAALYKLSAHCISLPIPGLLVPVFWVLLEEAGFEIDVIREAHHGFSREFDIGNEIKN
jgi:hypothetical protein